MAPSNPVIVLKKGREKPVVNHHPWIFSGAIKEINGRPQPGSFVRVMDHQGQFLAQATYHPHSQIRARILTWNEEVIDENFWLSKLERADDLRGSLYLEPETTAYRLVNAEADGLPGLIVDKYGGYLVTQFLTQGVDSQKKLLTQLLSEKFRPEGIVERSDAAVRRQEGLPLERGVIWGKTPPKEWVIQENGRLFSVNLLAGHKTGFYLDQRENRALFGDPRLVADKSILNVFAYSGGFGVYAAGANAGPIINIDTSAEVLGLAEKNIALNQLLRPKDEYIQANAFEILRYYRDEGELFDIVVLDPPKFAHSRKDIDRASRGYKDLNWLGIRLLRPGGLLATFSCSGRISADLFQKILFGAAVDAGRDVQIIDHLWQGPDHPILLSFPESAYLKGMLCRVW